MMHAIARLTTLFLLSFLITACGQEAKTPRAIYTEFTQSVNSMNSFSGTPVNKYLTQRASDKFSKGVTTIEKLPKEKRKSIETMALNMLKDATTWLDNGSAELEMNEHSAKLKTELSDSSGTITTKVLFKNEDGWKIDLISKDTKSSDGKTKTGESLFE